VKRTNCSACGYNDLRLILDLGLSPIADNYTKDDESVTHYPLQLAVCAGCHLVQLLEVVPDLFGSGYSFYSSASAPLSAYHTRYASDVLNEWHLRDGGLARKPFVVEIGVNDGDFSRHLTQAGWRVLGVDPALGPAEVAGMRGIETIVKPFGRNLAHEIHAQHGPADVIVANHVLAHVESVSDVFAGVDELLTHDGVVYVEVQYLPDMLLNNAIDLVYHEHRNFFSLTSLRSAARNHGLYVVDAQLTDRQGGSLRVKLRRKSEALRAVSSISNSEAWLADTNVYLGLQGRAERLRERLLRLLMVERAAGRVVAGYGAPAKGNTLLSYCGIDCRQLPYTVDKSPLKVGLFTPGTHIPVLPVSALAERRPDYVLILAWNFADEIMRQQAQHQTYGGRFILPIPQPTVV